MQEPALTSLFVRDAATIVLTSVALFLAVDLAFLACGKKQELIYEHEG
jgi:hypothetical protein